MFYYIPYITVYVLVYPVFHFISLTKSRISLYMSYYIPYFTVYSCIPYITVYDYVPADMAEATQARS